VKLGIDLKPQGPLTNPTFLAFCYEKYRLSDLQTFDVAESTKAKYLYRVFYANNIELSLSSFFLHIIQKSIVSV
jgi:hypothetical protein